MKLEQLEYIIAVAETGSMHAASDLLHVSQQNISKLIKQLEDELQLTLFQRSKSGTRLTDIGQEIYLHASTVMQEIAAIKQKSLSISPDTKSLEGELEIYASNNCSELTNPHISNFRRLHSNVTLLLPEFDSNELLSQLYQSDKIELAFVQIPFFNLIKIQQSISSKYSCFMIANEQLKVIMSSHSPYSQYNCISLKTLSQLPLACYSNSITQLPMFLQTLTEMDYHLNIKFISTSLYTLKHYISTNMAYCLGTDCNTKTITDDVHLRSIPVKENIKIALCCFVKKEHLSAPAQAFLDALLSSSSSTIKQLF